MVDVLLVVVFAMAVVITILWARLWTRSLDLESRDMELKQLKREHHERLLMIEAIQARLKKNRASQVRDEILGVIERHRS